MLRKFSLLLLVLLLSACTLAPEETPVPKTACPVCPTPVPCLDCPTCSPSTPCVPTAQATEPQPTYTPYETLVPTITLTPTEQVTETPAPTATVVPTATSSVPMFSLQDGTPAFLQNFTHPDLGCKWMGIAGQVLAADGSPVIKIVVEVAGMLGDQPVDLIGMTGSVLDYGEGGYEIKLADQPIATRGQMTIQLFDLDGVPLSDLILFDTSKDCAKNLILVNFTETRPSQP